MRQAQKSLVDEAQAKFDNDFDYKQDDQIKGVQQIVDLISNHPPIAVVKRLVDSFNKVINCRRKHSEDLNHFLSRYRVLAAEHLLRVGATSYLQVEEFLAITLLNNACIPETTLTTAKLQLIRLAEDRKEKEDVNSYSQTEKNAISLLDASTELKDICDAIMYKNEGRKDLVKRFTKIKHGLRRSTNLWEHLALQSFSNGTNGSMTVPQRFSPLKPQRVFFQ